MGQKHKHLTVKRATDFSAIQFPNPGPRVRGGPHLAMTLSCCDCGLVHEFEFMVVKIRRLKGGKVKYVGDAPNGFSIQWRAKRNNRATAQVRRRPHVAKVR